MKPSSGDDSSLQSLTRLIRRICLLMEQGDENEAVRLERTQLAEAVRQYRHDHGPEALSEPRLAEMFVTEQQRAADAVALAELLIPQLAARSEARRGLGAPAATGTSVAPGRAATPPVATSIPAFLDAMLADDAVRRRTGLFPPSPSSS